MLATNAGDLYGRHYRLARHVTRPQQHAMRAVGAKSHRLAPEVSRSGCASGFWAWLQPIFASDRDRKGFVHPKDP